MKPTNYSSVAPDTGNVTWEGPLSLQKGNHSHMPPRTEAYLPGENEIGSYDRGHVNASSLGGANTIDNITPQHSDLNRTGGAYYAMEQGERAAIQNGAAIESTKIAIVNSQPGDRPEGFMVSDHVSYTDGHMEAIHHSFTNASYAEQQAWNDQSVTLPGTFDAPNPGEVLSGSMSEYAELMDRTDAELPDIADSYAPADFSGIPGAGSICVEENADAISNDNSVDASADTDTSVSDDGGADCGVDD